jgi:D-glycero-D-manno-heptose 1,7-bisphosphate phosphatase
MDNIKHPAVFLDRDGVIIIEKEFQIEPEGIEFIDGAVRALKTLPGEFLKVIVSNQSGVAKGLFAGEDVIRFNQALDDRLRQSGITIHRWYFCPHGPDANCHCRKPEPGMLIAAARELDIDLEKSWMIGDKSSDILAGEAAGVRTILVRTGYAGHEPDAILANPDYVADDLNTAVAMIIQELANSGGGR